MLQGFLWDGIRLKWHSLAHYARFLSSWLAVMLEISGTRSDSQSGLNESWKFCLFSLAQCTFTLINECRYIIGEYKENSQKVPVKWLIYPTSKLPNFLLIQGMLDLNLGWEVLILYHSGFLWPELESFHLHKWSVTLVDHTYIIAMFRSVWLLSHTL